jgi:hypothetical protein
MMRLLYPLAPYMDNKNKDVDYWLQMTSEQTGELSLSPPVHIGSPGYYHHDLARIDPHNGVTEMVLSKQYSENITARPVNSLAFSYGTYTSDVAVSAKHTGCDPLPGMDFHLEDDHADRVMKKWFTVNSFINTTNQVHATITLTYER